MRKTTGKDNRQQGQLLKYPSLLQARRVLLNLAENAGLFGGSVPPLLRKEWHLSTPDIAIMDEDTSVSLHVLAERLGKALEISPSQIPYATRQQARPSKIQTSDSNRDAEVRASDLQSAALPPERTHRFPTCSNVPSLAVLCTIYIDTGFRSAVLHEGHAVYRSSTSAG